MPKTLLVLGGGLLGVLGLATLAPPTRACASPSCATV
jgi:hypothetical protein